MDPKPEFRPDESAETLAPAIQNLSLSSDPLSSADPLSCSDLDSLQDLARRGSWRTVLDLAARAASRSGSLPPHEHLILLSFQTLALFKLRRFSDASSLLVDSDLDLDLKPDSVSDFEPESRYKSNTRYCYESYPKLYPNRHGSMIPFALRWLYADLPHRLGYRSQSLDRLYSLLSFVRHRRRKLSNSNNSNNPNDPWKNRESFIVNSIISHHSTSKEFALCLALIRDLLCSDPSHPVLLSKLGYVQMQIGDLSGARESFALVEGLGIEDKGVKNLVNRNRALVYSVEKDYISAVREYEECIERDPMDVVAINNKALCLMYLRDLSDSIKVLEGALERVPTAALNETLIVNLCSMYELAFVNHSEIKGTLSNWIARVAPDDFDSSCTRI